MEPCELGVSKKRADNIGQFLELSRATDYHELHLSGLDKDLLPVS